MAQRLNKEDWLRTGFLALTDAGPAALKAEPLARRLGTTKGSFYWHFADVPTFQAALMADWEARAYQAIVEEVPQGHTAAQRLRHLAQVASKGPPPEYGGAGLEPAIRAWGRANVTVADAVARIDGKRMQYVQNLFDEIGLSNPELTRLVYGALLGMEELSSHDGVDNGGAMGTLVDLILALHA